MALFKCKMCGGALEINEDITVAECEYCGSKQTVPSKKDEVITNLFNRANNLRLKNEFDKAAEVYNKILNENDADAEAHWGLVLCKYGIEYVEDPKTYKRIPTCHRTQYISVLSDADYLAAVENADAVSKEVYAAEAKEIAELQKSILAIVKAEKPFDVFICYKETDENGKRTVDSTLANDIYYQLEKEGLRVFYAAITLEDKLGVEYEPYIFAALNSAKVMLAIGTKPEYFNSVWVKNEWSRYLGIMKNDREKMLIPCYRDMDAYDLPEEFAHLQAQDMSKIGFINDLVRGIKKVVVKEEKKVDVIKETVVTETTANIAPLLKRAFMFLEDGDWNSAREYCEKVLDIDPENAQAYLGKLMADQRVRIKKELKNCDKPFETSNNYQKILRFGDENLKNTLISYVEYIKNRNEEARLREAYSRAKKRMHDAKTEGTYKEAAQLFEKISEYKDSDILAKECYDKAETARKDAIYDAGKSKMADGDVAGYKEAIKILSSVSGWKDADEKIAECESKIAEIEANEEAERIERERKVEEAILKAKEKVAARKKKIKKLTAIVVPVACIIVSFVILLNFVIIPNGKYNDAIMLMNQGKYSEAIVAFEMLDGYKDSEEQIEVIKAVQTEETYQKAEKYFLDNKFAEALELYYEVNRYGDAENKMEICIEKIVDDFLISKSEKIPTLDLISDEFYQSHSKAAYLYALLLINNENWSVAKKYLEMCKDNESVNNYLAYCKAKVAIESDDKESAIEFLETIRGFLDVDDLLSNLYYTQVITSEKIEIDQAISILKSAPSLDEKGKKLLGTCYDLNKCIGRFDCYQKMKKDGTITTKDISYHIVLSFYLNCGVPYLKVHNSLFHDTTLYDAEVKKGTESYTYVAKCTSSESNNRTEDFWFSSSEAKYDGYVFDNIYYYKKK